MNSTTTTNDTNNKNNTNCKNANDDGKIRRLLDSYVDIPVEEFIVNVFSLQSREGDILIAVDPLSGNEDEALENYKWMQRKEDNHNDEEAYRLIDDGKLKALIKVIVGVWIKLRFFTTVSLLSDEETGLKRYYALKAKDILGKLKVSPFDEVLQLAKERWITLGRVIETDHLQHILNTMKKGEEVNIKLTSSCKGVATSIPKQLVDDTDVSEVANEFESYLHGQGMFPTQPKPESINDFPLMQETMLVKDVIDHFKDHYRKKFGHNPGKALLAQKRMACILEGLHYEVSKPKNVYKVRYFKKD